jgi:lysophospholipase L1-like esterase
VASHTISGQAWPDGTTVGVYPAVAVPAGSDVPSGSSVATAVVASGQVTFSGLSEKVRYYAYAAGSGRFFLISSTLKEGDRARIEVLEAEVGPASASRLDSLNTGVAAAGARAVPSNVVLVVGDSIPTQGAPVSANGVFTAGSLLMWANASAGREAWIPGAFTVNGVVSASGAKTSDNMTSHLTPALKTRPGVVVIQAGINDAINAVALSVTSANRQAMVEAALAQNIVPVLTTVTPIDGTTAPIRAAIAAINAWTTSYAAANGIAVCDFAATVTDPATGNSWRSGWTSDGTHPTSVGARALGATLAATLVSVLPTRPFPLALGTDPRSLYVNPLMAGSGGFPTNWTYESGAATVSLVSGAADGVNGNWWRIVKTGTSNSYRAWTDAMTVVPGNKMGMSFKFKATAEGIGAAADLRVRLMDTTLATNICGIVSVDVDPVGVVTMWAVGTVPVGVTSAKVRLEHGSNANTGEMSIAQLGVFDLTALGITA